MALSYILLGKLFSIDALRRSTAKVAVFMIYITPTTKAIQRQKEGSKLTHDPKTYQISELKNGNFYTVFIVNIFLLVCLFPYCLGFISKCVFMSCT